MIKVAGRQIDGVTFDLEGTVIDLEPLHFAAHVETARLLGIALDWNDPDVVIRDVPHFIGGPHESIMEELLDLAKQRKMWIEESKEAREAKLKQLSKYDRSTYINLRDGQLEYPLREGFIEFFKQLQAEGIPVAIGSLTDDKDAWLLIEKSGLINLFDQDKIILKSHVAYVKPAPEVYIKTAERMGISPLRQLVFEDSHNGVKAAREAGSIAIGMPTLYRPMIIDRLKQEGAVSIFESWKQVSLSSLRALEGNRILKEGRESGLEQI